MPINTEELVLGANTEGLRSGVLDYDELADAAERTEDTAEKTSKGIKESVGDMVSGAARDLAKMAVAYISVQGAMASLSNAKSFDAALTETSTLIDGTVAQMTFLEESAKSLADEYGTNATAQVEAFYQAISGGAGTVNEAATLLDQANKLAEGGITDVTTSVDILTTALGAYGKENITVAETSDALFVGMRAGKTTIDELAANLGKALPFANQLGISFEEVTAATATLTTQGISTAESVTGLKAAFLAVLKPGQEAKDIAADLGVEFNAAALEGKTFEEFLIGLTEAIGDDEEAMLRLFGSSEALGAVLALTGGGAEKYSETMRGMANAIGETDAAVEKINASLSDRFDDSLQLVRNQTLELGQALLVVAVPAVEAFAFGVGFLAENIDILLPPMIALGTAIALPAAIAGATSLYAMAAASVAAASGFASAAASIFAATSATSALAVAAGLLLTPLTAIVAVTALASGAFFLLRDNTDQAAIAAEAQAVALGDLDYALISVNTSTETGAARARQIAAAHYETAIAAREAAAGTAMLVLEEYERSQLTANPFDGPSLSDLRAARDVMVEQNAAIEALRERMAEFGAVTNEAGEVIDENTGRVVKTAQEVQALHAAQLQFMAADQARNAEAMAEADVLLRQYTEQAEMQRLIAVYGSDSVEVAQERAKRERDVVSEQLEGLDVAQSIKDEILNAVDATYQSEAATAAWAAKMSGVAAQVSAIASALGDFGNSAINTAANNAEIAALEAGASVQEAAHSRTIEQINLETKARIMGTDNVVEQMAIRAAATQQLSEVESQAALVAARAAAADTGGASGGSSRTASRTEAQKGLNAEMKEAEAILNSLMTPLDEYNDAMDQANRLLAAGVLPLGAYTEHVENLKNELQEAEWGEFLSGVEDVAGAMIDAGLEADSFGDVLGNMARAGVDALADLAAQMLKNYIMQQLMNSVSGVGGSAGGGVLGAIFGGARANGGPVQDGQAYLVNEDTARSEIFVPSSSGAILNVSQAQEALRPAASPPIVLTPAPVDLYDDPRRIDEHRRTPEGERARQHANRRLSNA